MDEGVRTGRVDRPQHRDRVEQVEHDGLRAEGAQPAGLLLGTGRGDDLVAARHELGDETGTDRTAGPEDENSHRRLLSWFLTPETRKRCRA